MPEDVLAVRPLKNVPWRAGPLFVGDGVQDASLLTSGAVLNELQLRNAINEQDDNDKKGRKRTRLEKKTDLFTKLIAAKPDCTSWGKGNLQLALSYKRIAKASDTKEKSIPELLSLWQKRGNNSVETGDEEEAEEGDEEGEVVETPAQKAAAAAAAAERLARFQRMSPEQQMAVVYNMK